MENDDYPTFSDIEEIDAEIEKRINKELCRKRNLSEELADPLGFDLICPQCGHKDGHSQNCPDLVRLIPIGKPRWWL